MAVGAVTAAARSVEALERIRSKTLRGRVMGPDEAVKAFQDLRAYCLVPMHYGSFKLSFEELDEPLRWLRQIVAETGLTPKLRILDEGTFEVF